MFIRPPDLRPPDSIHTHVPRRVQLLEVLVFLFLIVPGMGLSMFLTSQAQPSFNLVALSSILNDLALLSLVFYLLWRNGETLPHIGWTSRHLETEVLIGFVLFLPVVYVVGMIQTMLTHAGFSSLTQVPSFLIPSGKSGIALAVVLVIVVAIVEESIFRGYLLLRFMGIGNSPAQAVIMSSLIFSLGHGYEGTAGVMAIFVMGAILAVIYLWRQSLVAPIIIHFLTDFSSIVISTLMQR
jgi:uncharacterized protein